MTALIFRSSQRGMMRASILLLLAAASVAAQTSDSTRTVPKPAVILEDSTRPRPAGPAEVPAFKAGDTTSTGKAAARTTGRKAGTRATAGGTGTRTAAAARRNADSIAMAREDSLLNALWPVKGPDRLPGSILPAKRIVAYYGNPLSRRMGVLGEYDPDEMLRRLDAEVAAWTKADPSTPVQPALHLIAVVAQAGAGRDGKYRLRMDSSLIERVAGWAAKRNALVFLDVQVGLSTLQQELPALERFLARPNFHLGIDPEFSMKNGGKPGKRIGTFDAADVNYAAEFLAGLITAHRLPPKVLVVHRFTKNGVTNHRAIRLDPRVQVVMHMDGFGSPSLKKNTFRKWIKAEPVQFVGWKQFYKPRNDNPRTTIAEILRLHPQPIYIQYQ